MNRNPQKLRIAHVAAQLDTGGMERLLVEFARHADRARFDLHFISLGDRGTVANDIEACGHQVTTMRQPQGLHPSLIYHLQTLFRRLRTDIVHTHNVRPLLYAGPAARLAGVNAVIHTRHGQQYGATPRDLAHFRLATRLVDRVVSVSDDSTRLAAGIGVAPAKLRTVRNGIDLARFDYRGPSAGGPAVMIGRLSPEKDPHTLIRAAAIACAAEPSFCLEVAGDGKCMAALVDLTRQSGLERQIHFHGEVRDVAALLARASMFILPSLSEGISLSLLEAMARGLPVVATRVGGTPEVVDHPRTGLLIPAASPPDLARAMLQLYRDPAAARQMGEAAHRRVRSHFDVRRMVADYQNLYLQYGPRSRAGARAA